MPLPFTSRSSQFAYSVPVAEVGVCRSLVVWRPSPDARPVVPASKYTLLYVSPLPSFCAVTPPVVFPPETLPAKYEAATVVGPVLSPISPPAFPPPLTAPVA